MTTPLIELQAVSKTFRSNWTFRPLHAVADLSLAVMPGEVYGLIGRNGSGKTTTFKMLVGLLRPTKGKVLWNGTPLSEPSQRQTIGFSPEQPYFYDYLTVFETLNFYGQLYGMPTRARHKRIDELLASFHLEPKRKARMRTLSKGNMQRVAVAQAIMHRPRLAILDEPMSGLDPAGRKEIRDMIGQLKNDETTVLFSSHVLSDAEAVCDRVAILMQGALQEVVTIDTANQPPEGFKIVAMTSGDGPLRQLQAAGLTARPLPPDRVEVSVREQAQIFDAIAALQGLGAGVESVNPVHQSLEDRFLHYVPKDGSASD